MRTCYETVRKDRTIARRPPDIGLLLAALDAHGVRYVVTGSAAAMLHGVALVAGDLDITPALDRENLTLLAAALADIDARQDPEAPFGRWQPQPEAEQRWVLHEPTPEEIAARASWQPDPNDPASFDHLLRSMHGAIDVVPEVSGTYDELRPRAVQVRAFDREIWVESIEDILATLTVPRRQKDVDRVRELRALQRGERLG